MLDHVAANYLVKFIVSKRVGRYAKIVNHIGISSRIGIDPNRAREFILPAADVEDLCRRRKR